MQQQSLIPCLRSVDAPAAIEFLCSCMVMLGSARDPEGNDWDFGTYDPWAAPG